MTNENAKNYLIQYLRAKEHVQRLRGHIEELRQNPSIKAARIHSEGLVRRSMDRVPDSTGTQAAHIADLTEKLTAARLEELDAMENVCRVLDILPDPVQSRLLFDRYIEGWTWDQVAKDLDKDPSHVRGALYRKALDAAQQILIGETEKERTVKNDNVL